MTTATPDIILFAPLFAQTCAKQLIPLINEFKWIKKWNNKIERKQMNNQLTIEAKININAPTEKVWEALVNPMMTKKYMFGCEVVSRFEIGSPILWKGFMDEKEVIFVKGSIAAIEPGKHLAYTTIDPNSDIEDIPENYVTVTYDLVNENGQTVLSVTNGDFATVANGEQRYNDTTSGGGWDSILVAIKNLVERSDK